MEYHQWLIAPLHDEAARAAAVRAGGSHEPEFYLVDCDSRRGPFAATADLVRHITPALCAQDPAAIRAHAVELFTLVPDLWADGESLTLPETGSVSASEYTPMETMLIAHGVVDLLHAWGAAVGHSVVVYNHVERADSSELELLALALRRLPPELVGIVVRSGSAEVAEPLAEALRRHAVRAQVPSLRPVPNT